MPVEKYEVCNYGLCYAAKLSISVRNPCLPRWRLQVKQLGLIRKACERKEDKNASELNQIGCGTTK